MTASPSPIEPYRAAALMAHYIDILRSLAALDAADGFAGGAAPPLTASALPDRTVYLDRLGFTSAFVFARLVAALRPHLDDERREYYRILTGVYKIPGAEIARLARERLGFVIGGQGEIVGVPWAEQPATEAERAIFHEPEDGDLEIPAFLKNKGAGE